MEDYIFTPLVFVLGLLVHLAIVRRSTPAEGRGLAVAFVAHVFAALLQVWLVLYYFPGGGDMLGYFQVGVPLAEAVRSDVWRFLPELWVAFVRGDYHLPIEIGIGESTQSMTAAAVFVLLLTGDSLYASSMLVAVGAYVSQFLIYRALRSYFPEDRRNLVLIGTCLIPSGVFWSSALLKEPLVMLAIGPIVLALSWLALGRRRTLALLMLPFPVLVLGLLKPYVLMALSLAAGVFYAQQRLRAAGAAELKPFAVISAVLLAGGGLVVGSRYFAKGEAPSSASAFAQQRQVGYEVEGGSNYYLDRPDAEAYQQNRSFAQEVALAPLALVTALFRPFLFEARNAVQLLNALEATILTLLFIQVLWMVGYRRSLRELIQSPALLFCAVFTLALGLGTGLASSNLGTLSRYRAPMMPFYFTALMVLRFGLLKKPVIPGIQPAAAESPAPPARSAAAPAPPSAAG